MNIRNAARSWIIGSEDNKQFSQSSISHMRGTEEYNRPETEIESDSEAHNLDHLNHGIMSKAKMNAKKFKDRPNY